VRSTGISVTSLMALVALVAVEAASLRLAGGGGVDACRLLTVSGLAWATISARRHEGQAGAFWFGFALAGWAGFLLVLDALGDRGSNPSLVSFIPLRLLESAFQREKVSGNWASHLVTMDQARILHYMMVFPVAFVGGVIGWLAAPRQQVKRKDAIETAT
jgi:hypothetical protein